jgi:hypothetical protein
MKARDLIARALLAIALAGFLPVAFALPTVSLTAPTAGATFGNPASVTISATATPTSGKTITKVEFYRGGTTLIATVNAPGPYTTVWSATVNGAYSLTAKAYDSTGSTTSAARSITIATNTLPAVSISSPANNATFTAPASITINATATDTDGTISKVEFLNGTTLLNTDTAAPFSFAWTNVAAGTYSLTARATDNSGGVKTSTPVNVTVSAPAPPTVSLTSPANNATFAALANISLAASASPSSGATISKVEFFNGATLLNSDTTSPYSFAWNGVTGGTYTLTAKATDSRSATTTSAPVTVTVTAPPPPTVSLTSPANNATFAPPASITLTATATPGSGASISKVEFFNGATLLNSDTTSPYSFAWNGVTAGTYTLTAKATDNKGSATTSAPVNVTVAVPLPPPTVSVTSPVSRTTYAAPATIAIAATAAASAPATISRVDFFNGATLLGSSTQPPFTFNWVNVPSGGYSITAKATDSTGASATSAPSYAIVDGADSCAGAPPLTAADAATKLAAFGKLPIAFEANEGQAHADVRYQVRGPGYQLFLTPSESVLALQGPVTAKPAPGARRPGAMPPDEGVAVRMRLLGAKPDPVMTGLEIAAHRSNYLVGSDATSWRKNVPSFAKVRYAGLYPGIDEIFHGTQGRLEYDFVVAPGANPRFIRFALEGAQRVSIDRRGDLVLKTRLGELVQKKPVAYQEIEGERRPVDARYKLVATNQVAFELGKYDTRHPLVIDPVLLYSTYVGGTNNGTGSNAIALSRCGEAFIAGWTFATDFPTTAGALRRTPAASGQMMGFVSKLNASGTALVYSTYLTGTLMDLGDGIPLAQNTEATAIAVDSTGHAFVVGLTSATNFPTTPGSWNATTPAPGGSIGFTAKLNTDGTGLVYSTYVIVGLEAIAVDAAGAAYVAGSNGLWKIDPSGSTQAYAFTVGGSGVPASNMFDAAQGVAVDAAGNAYVTGITYSNDLPVTAGAFQTTRPNPLETSRAAGFVSKVNPAGTALVFATYLGTAGLTYPAGIALDASGNAYVTGMVSDKTGIPNFAGPLTSFNNNVSLAGNFHAFFAKLNASGASLAYFSRIGGGTCDTFSCGAAQTRGNAIAVDQAGSSWVTGTTTSNQIPLVKALQSTFTAGAPAFGTDLFAAKLSPSGASLAFSTLLGGAIDAPGPPIGPSSPLATGIALDVVGSAYVTGMTNKTDFPTTAGAFQASLGAGAGLSAFVAKINESKDSTTSLAVTPNPAAVGSAVTLTATVTGNAPTGTVTFKDGAATIGSSAVSGTTAQLVTTALAGGAHALTASYAGDAHNNPSVSASVSLNVFDPVTPPTATLTGITDGASFTAGVGGTYTGASVTLNTSAAAGNLLTQIRIYLDGTYTFWNVAASSATQPWSLPALAPGMHVIFATAQDNQGHTSTTPAVRFIVNPNGATPPTAVALTAPLTGASFVSPETIALAATATPASGKTIASVGFYTNGTQEAIASTSPYNASWFNSQPGTYSLRAVATDNAGGMAFSPPIAVSVGPPQPPLVAITLPGSGATYTAPATVSIAANATAAPGATITQVEFRSGTTVIGTATASPYTFSWTNVAGGSYSLTARATDSRTAKTTSSAVPITVAAAPALSISAAAGLNGSTVNESTMLVNGTITAPPNSGVTVNGILATVGTDGQFSVNEVPLAAGANTITLTVTTQDGATASQAITVNSSGAAAPFAVSVDEPDGIAPHTVTFSVTGGSTPVATIEFDMDGNGTVDYTSPGIPAAGVQATYSSAGTVRPRITFKDASGTVLYTTTKQVHVVDPQAKFNVIKGIYTEMLGRLSAGSITSASTALMSSTADKYTAVFSALGASLPSAVSKLGTVQGGTFTNGVAEALVVRTDAGGQSTAYTVYLIRGVDGIWRIDGM